MGSTAQLRPLSDYTVGWVCALSTEQAAAAAFLDDIHVDDSSAVPKPPGDTNSYILGSIRNHNIVIACLPMGRPGNSSAAMVATQMVSAFPRIKFGLMVGVGGGVPSNKVRLGDVVVSTPVNEFPGVVQWDMGKATSNGGFERTGALNNPPTALLTALGALKSKHEMVGTKIPEYLATMVTKWPRLSGYIKSDSLEDVLFKDTCPHVKESALDEQEEGDSDEDEICRACDKVILVKKRKARDARVHYGLIASGNQDIEDVITRKRINERLGNQVLCFEKEAAGLMNNFPCVVIRGICDYADSYKSEGWQRHAAAMAAALAKELLQYVSPADVEREPTVKDLLYHLHGRVSEVGADASEIKSEMKSTAQRDVDQTILNWLTPTDYTLQHNKHIKTHQEGTGQWLLDSGEFREWVETKQQTMFCPGLPGAGKTILTAVVIDSLGRRFSHESSVGIAYIYFNFWQQEEQTEEELFASLLKQLTQRQPHLPERLRQLFDRHRERRTRPSFDELSEVLHSVIRKYSKVFIVVDAVDECPASGHCRAVFLTGLLELRKHGANIFATSRYIPEITDKFEKKTWLEICARDEDVTKFVDAQISRGGSDVLRSMREEAKRGTVKAAGGMFLLAKLSVDSLLDDKLPRDIRAALKKLPKGSEEYHVAYENAMKRVEHQGPKSTKFAKTVLSWIVCARRPLTLPELRHALAFEIGDSHIDLENLPLPQDIVSVCAGLVTIDEGSGIVSLVHYTTQEYFEQKRGHWFPNADDDMARACATYLSFDVFQSGPCSTNTKFQERLQTYELYDYAARYWGHHAREAANRHSVVSNFLRYQKKVEASSQALLAVKESGGTWNTRDVPARMTGLHLAAYFGVEKEVPSLIVSYGRDPEDGHKRTPLSWAEQNGHEPVVRLLRGGGADPTPEDNSGLTSPSSRTDDQTPSPTTNGDSDTTARPAGSSGSSEPSAGQAGGHQRHPLLSKDIHGTPGLRAPCAWSCCGPDSTDYSGQTPLHRAAAAGDKNMIKRLLRTDAEEREDNAGRIPLAVALANGHKEAAKLLGRLWEVPDELLSALADSKLSGLEGHLFRAASSGRINSARLLIRLGVNMEAKGYGTWPKWRGTALLEAIWHQRAEMANFLISAGADKKAYDGHSKCPACQWAKRYNLPEVVKYLS